MKEITYVTGNWAKILSAKEILEPLGFEVKNEKIPTTEIQADTVEEVAKFSAKEASEKLKKSVLKNDTGLFVEALGGFPGPYTHYVDEKLGEDGILKLLENEDNRNACFIEAFAYCEYGKDPIVFTSITKGVIAREKSGKYGWSWDYIFIPEGKDKTLGCYPDEERCLMWNTDAYHKLAEYLKEKEK
ncbi:MAG: non-canonical purine NTP pyrophosphatase [Bacilli bacterium]|nr:non-canonical purine NTP pyrophosphatase [Bacilli bacterium]